MPYMIYRLEDLGRTATSLRKESFNSNNEELDTYLKRYALKNDQTGIAKTFVALDGETNSMIVGYYSCSANLLDLNQLSSDFSRHLPNYPPPAMLIGKLAVDQSIQGRGLGKLLLRHALENAVNLSENIGIYGVRVDAINLAAKQFYQRCGFLEYQDHPFSLFILLKTVREAMLLGN